MTLLQYMSIHCDSSVNWTSPQSPSGQDWFEVSYGLNSMPPYHPPSLKNPIKVKIPMAQDGWKRGDSKKSREQAMKDLVEIHRRLRYSKGKPTIARVADYPIVPPIGSQ